MNRILLMGCGKAAGPSVRFKPKRDPEEVIVRLDINPDVEPDVLHDLNKLPYPFKDNEFDEVHAYEVMEHLSSQGDYRFFFAQFEELARITKPDGAFCFTSPKSSSPWLWGDPGHTRYMGIECLTFLDQSNYVLQVGKTTMTDYRWCYKADWQLIQADDKQLAESNIFLLINKKES